MTNNVYIEVEVTTSETLTLYPEDFEEAYALGKEECEELGYDLVGYMCDALMDKLDDRADGYDVQYPDDCYAYLEGLVEDFIKEKENN